MKKKIIILGTILVVMVVGLLVEPIVTKNNTSDYAALADLINPVVNSSKVYVKTTAKPVKIFTDAGKKYHNYVYEVKAYDREGQSRHLVYTSFGKRLKTDRYLELTIKGQDVRNWVEVGSRQVPPKALLKLNHY